MTATAGSEPVQSGRPIFDDFSPHLWPYIGNNTANIVFQMVAFILRPIFTGPKRKISRSPNVSFNKSIKSTSCDMLRRLVESTAPDIMIVQFKNEKLVIMALYRSPLIVTLWPSSFLKKRFHQPIKRTKQSGFLM
ncbi:hypothetical protein TNCV_1721241 [Trichonephila clavipes]|nr:hypothetical protein TNCV_1721241 [Trichonephila clavipes]